MEAIITIFLAEGVPFDAVYRPEEKERLKRDIDAFIDNDVSLYLTFKPDRRAQK